MFSKRKEKACFCVILFCSFIYWFENSHSMSFGVFETLNKSKIIFRFVSVFIILCVFSSGNIVCSITCESINKCNKLFVRSFSSFPKILFHQYVCLTFFLRCRSLIPSIFDWFFFYVEFPSPLSHIVWLIMVVVFRKKNTQP